MALICPLVEGNVDEAVALRLLESTGHEVGTVYGGRGSSYIQDRIAGFNRSARGINYLVLLDLMDTREPCAPQVLRTLMPHPNGGMIFRVVVKEIESWLLADREGIARFLAVGTNRIPLHPETLVDPKEALVNIARRSRHRGIRTAIVPAIGTSSAVGRGYNAEICRFVSSDWNIDNAISNAASLRKCVDRLSAF